MLNQYHEFKGFWFVPGHESPVPGVLKFNPNDGLKLELMGDLSIQNRPNYNFLFSKKRHSIILGKDSNGKNITLIDCSRGASSLNYASDFPLVSYKVRFCLEGVHLDFKGEAKFEKLEIEVPVLLDWINTYPVNQAYNFNNEGNPIGYELSYDDRNNDNIISIQIDDDFKLEIKPFSTFPNLYSEEIKIKQGYYAVFNSVHPKSLFWFLNLIDKFIDFLNLVTFRNASIEKINFFSPIYFQESRKGSKILLPIRCFLAQEHADEIKRKWDFLLNFKSTEDELPSIIKKWYSFGPEMRPILYHLKKSIQPKKYFDSVDFLIVIQALEGYHTRFKNKNEISLKNRIKDLMNLFNNVRAIKNLIIDIKAIVDTRHYYSHFFPFGQKDKIYDGVELYEVTKKLKILLTCCILHELGLSNTKIDKILHDEDHFI